jgi:hypothetical protein
MDFELCIDPAAGRRYIQYNQATSKNYKVGLPKLESAFASSR